MGRVQAFGVERDRVPLVVATDRERSSSGVLRRVGFQEEFVGIEGDVEDGLTEVVDGLIDRVGAVCGPSDCRRG